MKQLRMFFMWPIIFIGCWYFFNFTIAVVVGFLYLHIGIILLTNLLDKYKEKLVQIVEQITQNQTFDREPLKDIFTGEDLLIQK